MPQYHGITPQNVVTYKQVLKFLAKRLLQMYTLLDSFSNNIYVIVLQINPETLQQRQQQLLHCESKKLATLHPFTTSPNVAQFQEKIVTAKLIKKFVTMLT